MGTVNRQSLAAAFYMILALCGLLSAQDAVITDEIRSFLQKNSFGVARTGDGLLHVYYKNPEAESVSLSGTFSVEMNEQEAGIWTAVFSSDQLDSAIFTFSILHQPAGLIEQYFYRGPAAPAAIAKAFELKGSFRHESYRSVLLGTMRQVTVYLPPGKAEHVIFMGDGTTVRKIAEYIEPLILEGKIPPVALAGSHPREGASPDHGGLSYRDLEYLEGIHTFVEGATDAPFTNHMAYFVDEFMTRTIREHNLPSDPARHSLAGFSNSAGFAISLAKRHPDKFKNLLLFAPIWQPTLATEPPETLPAIYLAYGSLEGNVVENIKSFAAAWQVEKDGRLRVLTAGHDEVIWMESFYHFIQMLDF